MTQSKELYESNSVWDQELQLGQKNVILALADFLPTEAETLLDVGCGDGKVTSALIKATGRSIVGLDFSEAALSRCKFPTVRGDATELPFEDEAFDVVLTTDTLEHLPDEIEGRAWDQLFRVAKKWVAVTVPFRENLQDAAIKCDSCDHVYHANWHMRSYDWRSLAARAPKGWSVEAIVLTGEAWPQYHPLEREFRSKVLDEWANWVDAVCPNCGAQGKAPRPPADLSESVTRVLGTEVYRDLLSNPLVRQYSEVLCFFKADGVSETLKTHKEKSLRKISLNRLQWQQATREINLVPYPEYPRLVQGEGGLLVAQFPVYSQTYSVHLTSSETKRQSFPVIVEDGWGVLRTEEVTLGPGERIKLEFDRAVCSGYYGILVRIPADTGLALIEMEEDVTRTLWYSYSENDVCYHRELIDGYTLFLQIAETVTIDLDALRLPFAGLTQQDLESRSQLLNAKLAKMLINGVGDSESATIKDKPALPTASTDQISIELKDIRKQIQSIFDLHTALNEKLDVVESVYLRNISRQLNDLAVDIRATTSDVDINPAVEVVEEPSEYDIDDGRPRVVMLCHDQHLDRRVLAQAQTLIAKGCKVTLFALSYTTEGTEEITPEGIRLIRIGLREIVPENPTYKAYVKRQNRLNSILNICCNRLAFASFLWRKMVGVAHRANWISYRAFLVLRYHNRRIADPLPFRSAFENAAMRVEADVLQVHDLPALEAGVNLSKAKGIPLVYDAHELYPEQRSFSKKQTKICSAAEASLIKKADIVFAVNESIASEMAKRYNIPKPLTLLNALDCDPTFDPNGTYDLLREKTGISPSQKILLYQGGYSPNRNLEQLITAMSLVESEDVVLVMLGFGDFGEFLKKRALKLGILGTRLFFLDAVPPQELIQHSASADMGIIPYPHVDLNSYYCTPNKLFEFMQAGLPILANDSPELRRFVADTGFGLVRPMHNAREIAAAIDEAFTKLDVLQCRASLLAGRQMYAWQNQCTVYVNAMMNLISSIKGGDSNMPANSSTKLVMTGTT